MGSKIILGINRRKIRVWLRKKEEVVWGFVAGLLIGFNVGVWFAIGVQYRALL